MIKIDTLYYYGQDGEIVPKYIEELFMLGTEEVKYSYKLKSNVFNIVGFIFLGKKMLVVFPKHYYELSEIEKLNRTNEEAVADIRLLYNVIKKYSEVEKTTAMARKYIGADDSDKYDADYPFASFYEVYDYFRKYGLYREKENNIKSGGSGKISWKATMRNSQKIISGGNLVFVPLYVNKKNYRQVFISECMAFVIDFTLDYFHSFFSMKKTGLKTSKFDYLENIDYVISKLNEAKCHVFKDIHKKLILSLMDFFIQYRGRAIGGKIHVKIRHYNMIWQKMINQFLNRHFAGIDAINDSAIFDLKIDTSAVPFASKEYNDIDISKNGFSIDIDHISFTDGKLYIFDSKYYVILDELNYKQFSYSEILRYHYPDMIGMYNVLLLPGRERSSVHFSLAPGYIGARSIGTKIIEQYLEPKIVMNDYLVG